MGSPQFWRLQQQMVRLTGGVCTRCGIKAFPPREVCPACHPAVYEARPHGTLSERPEDEMSPILLDWGTIHQRWEDVKSERYVWVVSSL